MDRMVQDMLLVEFFQKLDNFSFGHFLILGLALFSPFVIIELKRKKIEKNLQKVGKARTSWIKGASQTNMTSRSKPRAIPADGGIRERAPRSSSAMGYTGFP